MQTTLLSDLVWCDSPLQIVMAFRGTIIVSAAPDPESLNSNKKGAKLQLLSRPTGWAVLPYQYVFFKVEKRSDDISSRLFLMNKKGLNIHLSN
jgi:hypothetical protein